MKSTWKKVITTVSKENVRKKSDDETMVDFNNEVLNDYLIDMII